MRHKKPSQSNNISSRFSLFKMQSKINWLKPYGCRLDGTTGGQYFRKTDFKGFVTDDCIVYPDRVVELISPDLFMLAFKNTELNHCKIIMFL